MMGRRMGGGLKFILMAVVAAAMLLGMLPSPASALPLSTKGRWLVDDKTGHRVKLRGVNWVGHLKPLLPEGLNKQPLPRIAGLLREMGLNSVRLTYPVYLFTRHANMTVAESFKALNLTAELQGIAKLNPAYVNMTVVEAFVAVVEELGKGGILVVLDNQVSFPQWCCGNDDGNAFFGDKYFDPDEWLLSLKIVATLFKNHPNVVGMSLRNEIRGKRQNEEDWYKYVSKGATTVHQANPNVLVIISGLSYATNITFLGRRPLEVDVGRKLVVEGHWYPFTMGNSKQWKNTSPNDACSAITKVFHDHVGYVTNDLGLPLFIGEIGTNIKEPGKVDSRFLSCTLLYLAQEDLDFSLWSGQSTYYFRQGKSNFEEYYSVINTHWNGTRDPLFKERYGILLDTIQDPTSFGVMHKVLYHPVSGLCASANSKGFGIADCKNRSPWWYLPWMYDGGVIKLLGTHLCLRMAGEGKPVVLSPHCWDEQSRWKVVGRSGNQLAAFDSKGKPLCLEANRNVSTTIYTKQCISLERKGDDLAGDSLLQWFRLIDTNVFAHHH